MTDQCKTCGDTGKVLCPDATGWGACKQDAPPTCPPGRDDGCMIPCPKCASREAFKEGQQTRPNCNRCSAEWVSDLIEVVGFYANPRSYHAIGMLADRPAGEFADDFSDDHGCPDYDRPMPGKLAREFLDRLEDADLHPAWKPPEGGRRSR